ncbi:hypothetical protein V7088_25130, partial [Priestia megaterium]|uniref:hypothetical protein n=1 Tax=Priestia megaterium TaxID=1404 RepID=UPI002FFE414C
YMDLLSINVFITLSTTFSVDFNVGSFNSILDTIVSLVALYYTIKQDRQKKLKQEQTSQK